VTPEEIQAWRERKAEKFSMRSPYGLGESEYRLIEDAFLAGMEAESEVSRLVGAIEAMTMYMKMCALHDSVPAHTAILRAEAQLAALALLKEPT